MSSFESKDNIFANVSFWQQKTRVDERAPPEMTSWLWKMLSHSLFDERVQPAVPSFRAKITSPPPFSDNRQQTTDNRKPATNCKIRRYCVISQSFKMGQCRNFIAFICLLWGLNSFAQIHEFGISGGVTNYFGDLNTKASFKYVGPEAGVFYRYNIKYRGAWRNSFSWGVAQFNDEASKDAWNQQRDLSFRTNVFEASSLIEFNFFKYDKESKKHWFTPYIATGLCLFFFNPQAQYDGKWYYLQPLGTEGQNDPSYSGVKKYKLYSFAIPFVGGFKMSVARFWNFAIDGGLRQTFTKYLDDVSGRYPSYVDLPGGSSGLAAQLSYRGNENAHAGYQRGDGTFDKYMFASITVSYTIMHIRCPKVSGPDAYK